MAEGMEDQKRIIEEKDKLIKRQFIRIEELESELTALKEERDALLCDVNKLRFELEMSELKRLKDVRATPPSSFQSAITLLSLRHVETGNLILSGNCSPNFQVEKCLSKCYIHVTLESGLGMVVNWREFLRIFLRPV
ncbi:hypothetical protein CEXT_161411 [Caerostris extrusa]|uniref:Uncharacterized protein n=1 Tax=Caerostris extrusa TaxID=172846 RepID=A0AAV4NYB4_CAEEX|nr:hypothetical protein CEXT_161411 [Caerostris extrusa]